MLSKEEVILYRWKDPENKALVTPVMNILKINTDPPSVEEIKKLKAKLESAKALDFDQINTEFLKAEYNTTFPNILKIFLRRNGNQKRHKLCGKHVLWFNYQNKPRNNIRGMMKVSSRITLHCTESQKKVISNCRKDKQIFGKG